VGEQLSLDVDGTLDPELQLWVSEWCRVLVLCKVSQELGIFVTKLCNLFIVADSGYIGDHQVVTEVG
jgi:hypothetical protein